MVQTGAVRLLGVVRQAWPCVLLFMLCLRMQRTRRVPSSACPPLLPVPDHYLANPSLRPRPRSPTPHEHVRSCATGWRPDPVTFPNRCAAECAGGTVQKAGKCEHCNGDECTIGKRNDICFLAGHKNCWSKKYSCQVPANPDAVPPSGGSTQVFGRCLPKTPARLHHLRHLARAMLGDIIEEEADE